ncbi:hypothetical protein MRX96_042290 [Rhipicephalus microplus]
MKRTDGERAKRRGRGGGVVSIVSAIKRDRGPRRATSPTGACFVDEREPRVQTSLKRRRPPSPRSTPQLPSDARLSWSIHFTAGERTMARK